MSLLFIWSISVKFQIDWLTQKLQKLFLRIRVMCNVLLELLRRWWVFVAAMFLRKRFPWSWGSGPAPNPSVHEVVIRWPRSSRAPTDRVRRGEGSFGARSVEKIIVKKYLYGHKIQFDRKFKWSNLRMERNSNYIIQLKLLYVITLGWIETDNINRMITITGFLNSSLL